MVCVLNGTFALNLYLLIHVYICIHQVLLFIYFLHRVLKREIVSVSFRLFTCLNLRIAEQILIKFDLEILPLEVNLDLYSVISYRR
jgi:hypothetical protein